MSKLIEVKVPDLGGAAHADVIAINVKVGDHVAVDDALITLEGDKASMDIPDRPECADKGGPWGLWELWSPIKYGGYLSDTAGLWA